MRSFAIVCLVLLMCSACQAQSPNETNSAAVRALTSYLEALVEKDEATLSQLSCADWELQALLELDAFQSVETSLEGLQCQSTETGEGGATVVCAGKILTSYGGETQEYDLSERNYKLTEQNGEWLVCGY